MFSTLKRRFIAALLALLLVLGFLSPLTAQTASAHANVAFCSSNVYMYTRDDGVLRHEKYVGLYVPTDVTALYKQGRAYITYDWGDDHLRFDRNSWMVPRELNLWGVSSSWTITHSSWRWARWIAHYNC